MSFCGLDFGTSNSTLGTVFDGGPRLLPLENDATTLPSAIFFDFADSRTLFGRAAIDGYVEGIDGRLMRSLKSVLGTELIDQDTLLHRARIGFREVLAKLLGEIKTRGEQACGHELDAVVHGRPVHFVDGDDAADHAAEQALRDIAHSVGFRHVSFQYEPIAAALDYERQVVAEEIALIADIGGGTSDFSIVRLGPGRQGRDRDADILANDGVRIGGTDFDAQLSLKTVMALFGYLSPMLRPGLFAPHHYFTELATWSKINFLYTPQTRAALLRLQRESAAPELIDRLIHLIDEQLGHWLAMQVEGAKIGLSDQPVVPIAMDRIEPDLVAMIDRAGFADATGGLAASIGSLARNCLDQAGLQPTAVDAIFLTGGSTMLPNVRRSIIAAAPNARIVEGDKFGSVGLGLTLEASARYA